MLRISTVLLALLLTAPAFAAPGEPPDPSEVVEKLDAALLEAWKAEGVKPASKAKDTEFLRRVTLDLTGVIPDEETARAFTTSRKKDKRARLVQALLHSRNHANWMAYRWANLLVGRSYLLRDRPARGTAPLVKWLQQQFTANTHWDEVARQLIAAEGADDRNGAVQYLVRWESKPEEMAGNVMRVFQGQQVQCAQCHDHPYKDEWKQKDFWGVAAFFARARQQRDQDTMIFTLSERSQGEVRIPGPPGQPGPQVDPRFITGESIDPGEGDYRRTEIARILTSANNPYFVRATVNRVWTFLMGEGFTDPNDMSKPVMPEVLQVLMDDFKASDYDLRRLTQIVVSSRAYQLTSTGPAKGKDAQLEVYGRMRLRPLTAEQLWWSFDRAVGLADALEYMGRGKEPGWASQQKFRLKRRFFSVFGTNEDGASQQQSLTQALMLLNGPLTNDALLADRNPLIKELLDASADDRVMRLFLRVLGRPASKGERKALRGGGGSGGQARHVQDIIWALLNSSEFVYNH